MGVLDGDSPVGEDLPRFMVQVIFIIGLSRALGWLCNKINQPMVVAEMVAGILLGPSVLGQIPGFSNTFFPTESQAIINVMSNLGLILFLFLVGMELDPDILRAKLKTSAVISTIGVAVPFACSIPVAYLLYKPEYALDSSFGNFLLFLGVAMGISALPVLARILSERRLLQSDLGVVTMAATAIDDIEGWILLAIVVSVARASTKLNILYTVLLAIGNIVVLLFVVRPIMKKIGERVEAHQSVAQAHFFVIFFILFLFAWLSDIIGLSAIVGAFEVGCVVPRNTHIIPSLSEKLEDLVVVVFMPLFFTYSGLRTEFGLLSDAYSWAMFFIVFLVAFFSKVIGCAAAARWITKLGMKESLCFGVLMQMKGLVALVVFNLGLEYKVISAKLFAINVLMVLASTVVTAPLIEWIYPVQEMREKALSAKGQDTIFSILVCSPSPSIGSSLVSISESIVRGFNDKFSYKITGCTLVEGLKLSNYMTSLLNKTRHSKNPNLNSVKNRAKSVGIRVETMEYMKKDAGEDLYSVAQACNAHLILMGPSKQGNHDSNTLRHIVNNTQTSDVGVLVDKGVEKRITDILCPVVDGWWSNESVEVVMKYAVMMAKSPNVVVTVMQIVPSSLAEDIHQSNKLSEICGIHSSMKFIIRASPNFAAAITEETRERKYSLLMVPAPLPKECEEAIFQAACCSVLAIYPSGSCIKEKQLETEVTSKEVVIKTENSVIVF